MKRDDQNPRMGDTWKDRFLAKPTGGRIARTILWTIFWILFVPFLMFVINITMRGIEHSIPRTLVLTFGASLIIQIVIFFCVRIVEGSRRPQASRTRPAAPKSHGFFRLKRPSLLRIVLTLLAVAGVFLPLASIWSDFANHSGRASDHYFEIMDQMFFTIIGIACTVIVPFFIILSPRLTTFTIRDFVARVVIGVTGLGACISLLGLVLVAATGGYMEHVVMNFDVFALCCASILLVTLVLPPFLAFAIPSSFASIWFFILSFVSFLNPFGYLSGAWMPPHRRLKYLWQPRPLPRLPRSKSGFTLIELLITVAILAILAVPLANTSSVLHRSGERQQRWREALSLAEDAIADLRAQPAPPAEGSHPLGDPVAALHPDLKNRAKIIIASGPRADLRRVAVVVEFNDDLDQRSVRIEALLRVAPGANQTSFQPLAR